MPPGTPAGTGIHPDCQETDMGYQLIDHKLSRAHSENVRRHRGFSDCSEGKKSNVLLIHPHARMP